MTIAFPQPGAQLRILRSAMVAAIALVAAITAAYGIQTAFDNGSAETTAAVAVDPASVVTTPADDSVADTGGGATVERSYAVTSDGVTGVTGFTAPRTQTVDSAAAVPVAPSTPTTHVDGWMAARGIILPGSEVSTIGDGFVAHQASLAAELDAIRSGPIESSTPVVTIEEFTDHQASLAGELAAIAGNSVGTDSADNSVIPDAVLISPSDYAAYAAWAEALAASLGGGLAASSDTLAETRDNDLLALTTGLPE